MKFIKMIACLMAIISAISMLASCTISLDGKTTTEPVVNTDPVEQIRYKAKVHLIVTDHKGNEVYATDLEEPHEYDSGYSEPYIFTFIEDYAFFNAKEFSYETSSRNVGEDEDGNKIKAYTLESVTITLKKKTKTYAADSNITFEDGGKKYQTKTYWIFYINGKEVDDANGTILKDGDTIELRLSYNANDKSNPVEDTPAQ